MKLTAYLNFNGDCKTAFDFYQQVLGGEIIMMMNHENLPKEFPLPEGWGEKIMHARLQVGDALLMGSDTPPDFFQPAQGLSVNIMVDTSEEAERIFAALAENGHVKMPIEETFWATRFGMLVDKFGISWMVNCEKSSF